jgi:hypothetical protein
LVISEIANNLKIENVETCEEELLNDKTKKQIIDVASYFVEKITKRYVK